MVTRRTTTKRAAGIKPIRKSRGATSEAAKRHTAEAAVEKPAAPTKESVLAQIGTVLDEVDTLMRDNRPKRDAVDWNHVWRGPLEKHRTKVDGLYRMLDGTINPDGELDGPDAEDVVSAAFGAERGTVPSWARPGEFLMWLGYIPYRCVWGGFAKPSAIIHAVDPRGLFSEPDGYHYVHGLTRAIDATWPDVAGGFRAALAQLSADKSFVLKPLGPDGVKSVTAWLATPEAAWAIAAIKAGPVKEVPLPARFAAVQQRMFA